MYNWKLCHRYAYIYVYTRLPLGRLGPMNDITLGPTTTGLANPTHIELSRLCTVKFPISYKICTFSMKCHLLQIKCNLMVKVIIGGLQL